MSKGSIFFYLGFYMWVQVIAKTKKKNEIILFLQKLDFIVRKGKFKIDSGSFLGLRETKYSCNFWRKMFAKHFTQFLVYATCFRFSVLM